MPKVIEVIVSDELRGRGIEGDPFRRVQTCHSLKGESLFEEIDQVGERADRKIRNDLMDTIDQIHALAEDIYLGKNLTKKNMNEIIYEIYGIAQIPHRHNSWDGTDKKVGRTTK